MYIPQLHTTTVEGVDLTGDYDTEIKPFLGKRLVRARTTWLKIDSDAVSRPSLCESPLSLCSTTQCELCHQHVRGRLGLVDTFRCLAIPKIQLTGCGPSCSGLVPKTSLVLVMVKAASPARDGLPLFLACVASCCQHEVHRKSHSNQTCVFTAQGAGGFGEVFECMWRGQQVAVKKLPVLLEEGSSAPAAKMQYRALIAEIMLSCRFKCDRLVRITGRVTFVLRDASASAC